MQQNSSNEKNRKSEAQKAFEEADNAGRFAGDDADANQARARAEANLQQAGGQQSGNRHDMPNGGILDGDDVRPEQGNMLEPEAQNINKTGQGDALMNNDSSLEHARNKATQGIQEGRDTGSSDDRSRNSGTR